MRRSTLSAVIVTAAISLAACTSPSTSPSTSASTSPSTPSFAAASAQASASAPASAAPSAVAAVPTDQLIFPDKLVVCSDIPYPPLEFFDAAGNPTGSDIDIATEIATRLGLTVQIENSVFDTIIAAVTGGKCDIIISDQNITAERLAAVDMIPYFQAGQSFVVAKGNPKALNTTTDLCGKSIAAETGTTEVEYVNGTGDYKGKGLSKACTDAGKTKIDMKEFQKDTDALTALLGGQVDAYFADTPPAAYYTIQHPDQFELSGIPALQPIKAGISIPKDKTGLRDAVKAALLSMMTDGKYQEILKKYNVADGAVQPSDIK
jgi:ABC-type amino acid transport/signal transduction systems, periplasmic component/domain